MKIAETSLSLRSRRNEEPILRSGRLILKGELDWLLEGSPEDLRHVQLKLPGFSEKLSDNLLILGFGNSIGVFDVPVLGRIEITSGKWGRRDFDRMILDITEIAAGLPFAGRITGALPYDRSAVGQEPVLYHAFVYLRHSLSQEAPFEERVLPALGVILSEPHRLFARVRRDRKPFALSKVDSTTLHNIVTGRRRLERAPVQPASRSPLALALGGYLPVHVDEPDVAIEYDTAENRFVKAVIEDAIWIVSRVREIGASRKQDAFTDRLLAQCAEIERVLSPAARDPFWRRIGRMVHVPSGSTVLQRRRGYRQIYRHYVKSRLSARVPVASDDMFDFLEAKDISQLYELWCFFALLGEVQNILGRPLKMSRPDSDDLQVSLRWEFEARWHDGTKLTFNPRFSRGRPKPRFAYSVPLRPDFALEVPFGPSKGLHLFDAKFRVERIAEALSEAEQNDETEQVQDEERTGTFKIADLYKMHTYRDSIREARTVWALYPGEQFAFFCADGKVAEPLSLPGQPMGVGAIPLRPNLADRTELRDVVSRLFSV